MTTQPMTFRLLLYEDLYGTLQKKKKSATQGIVDNLKIIGRLYRGGSEISKLYYSTPVSGASC